jgi:hypothetical protein
MIELRYLTRVRVIPGVPPQIDDCDERVLQYRDAASDGRPLPEGFDYNWSNWTDVPEVSE